MSMFGLEDLQPSNSEGMNEDEFVFFVDVDDDDDEDDDEDSNKDDDDDADRDSRGGGGEVGEGRVSLVRDTLNHSRETKETKTKKNETVVDNDDNNNNNNNTTEKRRQEGTGETSNNKRKGKRIVCPHPGCGKDLAIGSLRRHLRTQHSSSVCVKKAEEIKADHHHVDGSSMKESKKEEEVERDEQNYHEPLSNIDKAATAAATTTAAAVAVAVAGKNNRNQSTDANTAMKWEIGQHVEVQSRTGPGINKPGGCARIMKVHRTSDGTTIAGLDVKYLLGGGTERKINPALVFPIETLERGRRKRRSRDFLVNKEEEDDVTVTAEELSNIDKAAAAAAAVVVATSV